MNVIKENFFKVVCYSLIKNKVMFILVNDFIDIILKYYIVYLFDYDNVYKVIIKEDIV